MQLDVPNVRIHGVFRNVRQSNGAVTNIEKDENNENNENDDVDVEQRSEAHHQNSTQFTRKKQT